MWNVEWNRFRFLLLLLILSCDWNRGLLMTTQSSILQAISIIDPSLDISKPGLQEKATNNKG